MVLALTALVNRGCHHGRAATTHILPLQLAVTARIEGVQENATLCGGRCCRRYVACSAAHMRHADFGCQMQQFGHTTVLNLKQ
jgi:hypothetical protein